MIGQGSFSTQTLATSYIAALAPSHPFFQSSFISVGTVEALEAILSTDIGYNRDSDPLLFSARRTLVAMTETKVLSIAKLIGHQGRILERNSFHLSYTGTSGFWDVRWYNQPTPPHDPEIKVMLAWEGVVENNRNLVQLLRGPQTRTLAATTFARLYTPQHISKTLLYSLFAQTTFRDPATIQYLWFELSRAKDVLDQIALLHVLEVLRGHVESSMGLENQVTINWKWNAFFEPAMRFCMSMPSFSSPFLDHLFQDLLEVMEATPYKISYIFPSIVNLSASFHLILDFYRYQTHPLATDQRTSTSYSLASRAIQTLLNPFFHYRIQLSLDSSLRVKYHSLPNDRWRDPCLLGVKKGVEKSVPNVLARQLVSLFDRGHCTAGQVMQVCEEHPDLERPVSELVGLSAGRHPGLHAAFIHGSKSCLLRRQFRCTGILRRVDTMDEPGSPECLVTDSQHPLRWLKVTRIETQTYNESLQPLPIFHPSPVDGQGPFYLLLDDDSPFDPDLLIVHGRSLMDKDINFSNQFVLAIRRESRDEGHISPNGGCFWQSVDGILTDVFTGQCSVSLEEAPPRHFHDPHHWKFPWSQVREYPTRKDQAGILNPSQYYIGFDPRQP
ncbi:hypothetical protein JAAARDRAFT_80706 [Jaapia argillacea MUCL 33604]|uniref:Uncharacterized protein n=1 Tax=Jaapia argillacea MUCL 33604 TaxID=933084 RepID=A0A067PTH4_9AGAM|nr:hypothetical protein JAAARDRAFT_80706 [Jaapia argillacea MUCL 33604]